MTFNEWKLESYDYSYNAGFWDNFEIKTKPLVGTELNMEANQNIREEFVIKLALVITEVSEAIEELRKKDVDSSKFGEELGDIFIRMFDLAYKVEKTYGISIEGLMEKKRIGNKSRGHKHGKAF